MKKQKYKKNRENILANVQSLTKIYGLNSDIIILIHENVVIYGIMNKGKTFYSINTHRRFSTIALYHKSLTIAFLSDLSKQIYSIVEG